MRWRPTDDPDVIECKPYFIRRGCSHAGAPMRYLLGRVVKRDVAECLGGFDSADGAKARASEIEEAR